MHFQQSHISSKQMYQNLLALHSVDASNQEVITDEDIYAITDTMDSITVEKTAKKRQVQATASTFKFFLEKSVDKKPEVNRRG